MLNVVRSTEPRDRSKINTLDYMLMTVGSILAVYAAGMSIGQPGISIYFIRIVLIGAISSFFIRRYLASTPFIKADGVLYAIVAVLAVVRIVDLNGLLPGEGFPRALFAASWLAWMLSLGSFLTWRDGTLLFQAVPAIALFGLVGCYDTFREVTFCFFGFLICLATLFARAHGRDMLRLVIDSGYAGRAEQKSRIQSEVRQDQALYERMRLGPWRWLAGPEWALASALAVVGLSLLGAPVIKASVESVAGNVKVNVSQAVNIQQNRQESFQQQENLRVGNGPNRTLSDRPLWEYESSGGTNYLRTTVFDEFTGSGWKRGFEGAYAQAYQWIADPSEFEFRVRRLTPMSTLPSPGEVLQWREQRSVRRLTDGTFAAEGRGERSEFNGIGIEPRDRSIYVNSLCDEFLGTPLMIPGPLPDRVKRFVDETILGAKTDREKAERIVQAVSSLVKYNINAVAITNGENAVDEFLFETKEGYCDLFATAMTVCARHAGLPARYVQGFLPDVQNRDGAGRQLILEKDYHAWCEILFEDAGWVVFDATAYAESVPGGERGRATSSVPFWETSAARQMLDSGVVGLVVVAFVVAIYLRVRPSGEALKRREIDRVALEFVRVLEKATKQRRRLSQTLLEFADSLANTLPKEKLSPDKVAATQRIAKEITQRMYGPSKVEESDLRSLRQEINRLKGELKKST